MWIAPIFDRTLDDVQNRSAKVQFNEENMNRLEGNVNYLSDLFSFSLEAKTWDKKGFLKISDIKRILYNIEFIRARSFVLSTTPQTPVNLLLWSQWNAAEEILYDVYRIYMGNRSNGMYMGNGLYAGQGIGVM